jgi:hypothetical protein
LRNVRGTPAVGLGHHGAAAAVRLTCPARRHLDGYGKKQREEP